MFGLSRYCGMVVGRSAIARLLPIKQNLYTHSRSYSVINKGLISTRCNPLFISQRSSHSGWLNKLKLKNKSNTLVGGWLLTCSGMVFVGVVLGGITRLTESGLSMVTWKLLAEKMPTSESEWHAEFERYKQFPEYKMCNQNMTLAEFKRIWWTEYLHRTWGRLIGAVFLIPAATFWAKGLLRKDMKIPVLVLGSLIGLQGLMGWYMVKSGLEDRFHEPSDVPRVSQYRLAAHLGLAFLIYIGFLYNSLKLLIPASPLALNTVAPEGKNELIRNMAKFKKMIYCTKGLAFLTALSGAFVAGMDAGLIYNTFPKMADKWIPDDIFAINPVMKNFVENPTTVQFDHRILGLTTLTLITALGVVSRKYKFPGRGKQAMTAVLCVAYLQVLLGITTLLHHVPVALAATHQSGSLILLSAMTWLCHELRLVTHLPK